MNEIKLIKENTDLNKVLHELEWDAVVKEVPYKVFFAYDDDGYYCHSDGGKHDYAWACPRDEQPTYENLVQFNGQATEWGLQTCEVNSLKCKWNEEEIDCRCITTILRNGKEFNRFATRDMAYGIAKAQVMIEEYKEHPLELNNYQFERKCIGRKIRYKGIPAIIDRYCDGQACIMIKPRFEKDIDRFFKCMHNIDDETVEDYYEEWKSIGAIKEDILSSSIWWFE